MGILIFIIVAIIMATIASKKGFNPWLWVLAGGVPGFIILLILPSAKAYGIDEETIEKRRKVGNNTGGVITIIAVILVLIMILWVASIYS